MMTGPQGPHGFGSPSGMPDWVQDQMVEAQKAASEATGINISFSPEGDEIQITETEEPNRITDWFTFSDAPVGPLAESWRDFTMTPPITLPALLAAAAAEAFYYYRMK